MKMKLQGICKRGIVECEAKSSAHYARTTVNFFGIELNGYLSTANDKGRAVIAIEIPKSEAKKIGQTATAFIRLTDSSCEAVRADRVRIEQENLSREKAEQQRLDSEDNLNVLLKWDCQTKFSIREKSSTHAKEIVKKMNRVLSWRVAVRLQTPDSRFDDDYNFGFAWNNVDLAAIERLIERRFNKKQEAKRAAEEKERNRIANAIAQAKITNNKVAVHHYCLTEDDAKRQGYIDSREDESDMVDITVYVLPDGTYKTVATHCY
jgi:hypothetical protein